MYIYVVIFVKDIRSRDRAIYDRAPKTVPKYFDLHKLIYIEVELGRLCEENVELYSFPHFEQKECIGAQQR